MSDLLTRSLNSPEGDLARILVDIAVNNPVLSGARGEIISRLDRLMSAGGQAGLFTRVRLAADVGALHRVLPDWTERNLVPLLDWGNEHARDYWSARKYAPFVGSPRLTELTKKSLLALFNRRDVTDDDKRAFAEWLVVMAVANATKKGDAYPIALTETRGALRKGGVEALSSAGHRLAAELRGDDAAAQGELWRKIVGPVFKGIWPLDIELTSDTITFKLVQILTSTGDAVNEAAEVIIPFIRKEARTSGSTLLMLADAKDHVFKLAPDDVVRTALALLGGEVGIGERQYIEKIMRRAVAAKPKITAASAYRRLANLADASV